MSTIPSKTPTVTIFNTRIPTAWYHILVAKAEAANQEPAPYIRMSIRSQISAVEEQQQALNELVTITYVRQLALKRAHPDLPEWHIPRSTIRANTPTMAAVDNRPSLTPKGISPRHPTTRRFYLEVDMTQATYYGIKHMAKDLTIKPEELARKMLKAGYDVVTMSGRVLGDDDAGN